jgi:hypothetical protein
MADDERSPKRALLSYSTMRTGGIDICGDGLVTFWVPRPSPAVAVGSWARDVLPDLASLSPLVAVLGGREPEASRAAGLGRMAHTLTIGSSRHD